MYLPLICFLPNPGKKNFDILAVTYFLFNKDQDLLNANNQKSIILANIL